MLAGLRPLLKWEGCNKYSISSLPSPRRLAAAAVASGEEYVALLESGGGQLHRSRFSLVAVGAESYVEHRSPEGVYESLRRLLSMADCESLPCSKPAFFTLSYEAVADEEPWLRGLLDRHEWPVLAGFTPDAIVVYDHYASRAAVCPKSYEPRGGGATEGFRVTREVYSTPRGDYVEWVSTARRLIEEGEAFQVVLSRVESYEYRGSLYSAYERLASINPSPYMYYLKSPAGEILGASPELLIKLERGILETHPIAGTRPRGEGEEDILMEEELLSDEKELAEHIMLVDLARNDLGRIAEPGSVEVASLMDVEKYSRVQHIVSRVVARARDGLELHEAIAATLPAGTVSGAPKPRAMEIIAVLEDKPRGPYAGAVGLGGLRAGEAAIVIRSAWSLPDGRVELRAGAGIVYDSRPEREYMETVHKLKALREALGVERRA